MTKKLTYTYTIEILAHSEQEAANYASVMKGLGWVGDMRKQHKKVQEDPPRVRTNDPDTSQQGAKDIVVRAGSQKHELLNAYLTDRLYGDDGGLTDEEAAQSAALSHIGYWKRCSELRQGDYITPVLDDEGRLITRAGSAGSQQMVCTLTPKGLQAAMKLS